MVWVVAAAAGAAERERVGTLGIVGVHPAHHSVGPPARTPGHLGGAAVLGDVKQGERPFARAGMRRRAQADGLRAEVDRSVISVVRDVMQCDEDRHGPETPAAFLSRTLVPGGIKH